MRVFASLFLTLCLGLSATARAELRYFVYDLAEGKAEAVAKPEDVLDERYHSGSLMLFVQDTALSASYAIGVFEVTRAQAQTMGWGTVGSDPHLPFSTYTNQSSYDFSSGRSLPANVAWPTTEQWEAYAGEKWKPCNAYHGRTDRNPVLKSSWWESRDTWTANAHGVYNIYGNVAEYTTDGLFHGGYALRDSVDGNDYNDDNFGTGVAANAIGTGSDNTGFLGARLIYNLPEEQRHTLTVTLDGETVRETTHKPGEAVTVTPPEPQAWHALTGRAVSPEGLEIAAEVGEGFAFEMPGEAVTVAYASTEYAEIAVVGGTLALAEGHDRAYVGDTVTVSADAPEAWQDFLGWEATGIEAPDEASFAFAVTAGMADTVTLTARFGEHPIVLIRGGAADPAAEDAEGHYKPGTTLTLTPAEAEDAHFLRWEREDGTALEGNTFTVPQAYGQTLTLTAVYEDYPRVIVQGGTASPASATGRYAPGAELTLTPAVHESRAFQKWVLTREGAGSEDLGDADTFTVPEDSYGQTLTLTAVYRNRPRVIVLGGDATPAGHGNGFHDPGERLTLTPNTPEGLRFQGWRQGEGTDATILEGDTFTVGDYGAPTVTLTALFGEPPRVLVSGGTATVSSGEPLGEGRYTPGTVLTLKHDERVGYAFLRWEGGDVSGSTFTVPDSGDTVLTAVYAERPRVLVAGGSANPAATNGYYSPGDRLTLTPDTPSGYVFDQWKGGDVSGDNTYTVGDYGSGTVTLTAVFTVDEDAAGSRPIIHLGSKTTADPHDTLFGSTPASRATTVTDAYGNKFVSFAYADAPAVAVFDLKGQDLSYANAYDTSAAGKSEKLQLRRVNAADGHDFYMGVFETTVGNVAYLEELAKASPLHITDKDSTDAYTLWQKPNGSPTFPQCLTLLRDAFGLPAVRFPTQADVIAVGDAVRDETPRAGYGYGTANDPDITTAMIVYNSVGEQPVGNAEVDPYGFYDLWGNHWETSNDGTPFGGSAWEPLSACHTENAWGGAPTSAIAFRPVIDVEAPVAITVEGAGTIWAVEGEKLFPAPTETPDRPGYDFLGWTLGGTEIDPDAYVVRREDDGKTLAMRWKPITLTAEFIDCEGPEAVVPGLVTRVLTDPNRTLSGFTIVPKGAAAYSFGTGFAIVTFSKEAKGHVTVTATYNDPKALTAKFVDCQGPATVAAGETYAVTPTDREAFRGLVAQPGEAVDWALTETGATITFAPDASGTVTLTALYAGRMFAASYEGCQGPETIAPGLVATLYLEPDRVLERVEIVPAGAATWDAEARTLTFAGQLTGDVTVTAHYAQPRRGFRLRLR